MKYFGARLATLSLSLCTVILNGCSANGTDNFLVPPGTTCTEITGQSSVSGTCTLGAGVPVSYAALGASDAVGVGASVPCGTTISTNPTCPGGTGYVPKIAALLADGGHPVVLSDLGLRTAVIGPDIKNLGNLYGTTPADMCTPRTGSSDIVPSDILSDEIPNLPLNGAYVTILAGADDVIVLAGALGCGAGGTTLAAQLAFIAAEASAFANDYAAMIVAVKKASPNASIVVANLPNLAGIPLGLAQPTAARQALQAFSIAFDTVIDSLAAQNIPVADLLCSTQTYAPANFFSDGLHPNDSGYALLASLMEPLLLSKAVTPLSTTCSQASLASAYTKPFSRFTLAVPPPVGELKK
jgi:lysophospholipase L1-like esterase